MIGRGVNPGGGGGAGVAVAPPPMKILGGKHRFELRQLEKLTICNAKIGLKSTIRHYKTIKFNIKALPNIHNFQFARKVLYCDFAQSAPKILTFSLLLPPPPQSEKWIDAPDDWLLTHVPKKH